MREGLVGGVVPKVTHTTLTATPDAAGQATVLKTQTAGGVTYFDVAGLPGRTVGLTVDRPR